MAPSSSCPDRQSVLTQFQLRLLTRFCYTASFKTKTEIRCVPRHCSMFKRWIGVASSKGCRNSRSGVTAIANVFVQVSDFSISLAQRSDETDSKAGLTTKSTDVSSSTEENPCAKLFPLFLSSLLDAVPPVATSFAPQPMPDVPKLPAIHLADVMTPLVK